MPRFEKLTCMIEKLNSDEFGTWKFDNEHKGTKDDPMHFPFPIYTDAVHELMHVVHDFVDEHPEYPLRNYKAVMDKYNIENLQSADIDSLNDEATLALLVCVVRGERFCDGLILANLKEGRIQHLLMHLKDIDEGSSVRS